MLSLLINKLFSANIDQNITKVNKHSTLYVKMYIHFNIHKQHIINLLLDYFKIDPNYAYLYLQIKTINFDCSDFKYIFDWIYTGDP